MNLGFEFDKKGKLGPFYIGPYQVVSKVRNIAYELDLPASLASIHPIFFMSMTKTCMSDHSFIVPIDDAGVLDSLSYEEVSIKILYRQFYRLRTKDITSVRVLWRNHKVEESTWEDEEDMRTKYLFLFPTPDENS